jgi:type IV fimbrial biogenesis protein FimT
VYSSIRASNGFTLGELMTTLAVAMILAATTIPAYTSVVQRNQISAAVNAVVAELNYARSEALKRSEQVTVCPSDDGSACISSWSPSSAGLRLAFIDEDGDNDFSSGVDVLLKSFTAEGGSTAISSVNDLIEFSDKGYLLVSNATLQFGLGDYRRCLSIGITGRMGIESEACTP